MTADGDGVFVLRDGAGSVSFELVGWEFPEYDYCDHRGNVRIDVASHGASEWSASSTCVHSTELPAMYDHIAKWGAGPLEKPSAVGSMEPELTISALREGDDVRVRIELDAHCVELVVERVQLTEMAAWLRTR